MSRQNARETLAHATVARLTPDERAELLEEWWSLDPKNEGWDGLPETLREELRLRGEAPLDPMSAKYDPLLRLAVMQRTLGVQNSWIQEKLKEMGLDPGEIIGDPERMLPCRCCGYLTLEERGGYDICPVCFWEDDGSKELDLFSSPNHMTLREGKMNFARFGACSENAVRYVIPDGPVRYPFGDAD